MDGVAADGVDEGTGGRRARWEAAVGFAPPRAPGPMRDVAGASLREDAGVSAEVARIHGVGGRVPSGWEWNGSQPGQGAAELLLPGPAPGKMQGEAACRAGDPSGQAKTRRLRVLVVTIC